MAGGLAEGARGLSNPTLRQDGAQRFHGAAASILKDLAGHFTPQGQDAGTRLWHLGDLACPLGPEGAVGRLVTPFLGREARPVRAIAFDKSLQRNWALGWHQDRTICVRERHDMEGFGPWTVKHGMQHVQPPFTLLEEMITARIHLDKVDEGNAPLRIALGSHLSGAVKETRVATVVGTCEEYLCLADAGDVWLYATPILHASDRASGNRRRRVLQVDYCARSLPPPLDWAVA